MHSDGTSDKFKISGVDGGVLLINRMMTGIWEKVGSTGGGKVKNWILLCCAGLGLDGSKIATNAIVHPQSIP